MKPYANITCGVLTPLDLRSKEQGDSVLQLLARHPLVSPTHVGNHEPIRDKFNGLGSGLDHWDDPFLWRNNRTKVRGSIWFGQGSNHSCIYAHAAPSHGFNDEAWAAFLVDACNVIGAELGYIHVTTQSEFEDPEIPRDWTYAIDTGLTSRDLQKGVLNLCWGMYYSGSFLTVGQQLRDLPSLVATTSPTADSVYVQLVPSMSEICNDYGILKTIRHKVNDQIGGDLLHATRS